MTNLKPRTPNVKRQIRHLQSTILTLLLLVSCSSSPTIQPTDYDFDSCAEWLLVKDPNGAIGYIGCYTGSQAGGLILAKYFFDSYNHLRPTGDIAGDPVTLGRMWNWALNKYFDNQCHYTIDLISTWYAPTMVHHAQKYLLFGDPSLRLVE